MLETWISPPMSSTSRLLMARPRPVPPCLRVRAEASTCWNGLNRSERASGRNAHAGVADGEIDPDSARPPPACRRSRGQTSPSLVNLIGGCP